MYWLKPIAVKPYVKKYIAGNNLSVAPFELSTTNKYGMFLYHCLRHPEERVLRLVTSKSIDISVYTDSMDIKLTEKRWREIGCIISNEAIIHFNKFVQQDFNEEFYKFVKHRVGPKGTIYRAIHNFRDIYGISEDEFSYRSMERAFQRRNAPLNNSLSA